MNQQTKTILKSTLIFVMVALSANVFAAWSAPTAAAPGANTQPPVNVGSATQFKNGGLVTTGLRSTSVGLFDSYIQTGNPIGSKLGLDGSDLSTANTASGINIYAFNDTTANGTKYGYTGGSGGGYPVLMFRQNNWGGQFTWGNTMTPGALANYQEKMRLDRNGSLTVSGNGYFGGSLNATQYCIAASCITAWPSGGTSQWTTSGSNIYYTTGTVGIGTTTPSNALEIKGAANQLKLTGTGTETDIRYLPISGHGWQVGVAPSAANSFQFYEEGPNIAQVTIKEGGNVGIGTTAPGTYKLNVNGSVNATQYCISAANCISAWPTSTASQWTGTNPISYTGTANVVGNFSASGTSNFKYYLQIDNDTNANNLGFHWNAYSNGTNTYNYINTAAWGGTAGRLVGSGNSLSYDNASGGVNPIAWVNRFTIAASGYVGIGNSSPAQLLTVGTAGSAANAAYNIGVNTMGVNSSLYSYGFICAGNSSGFCTGSGGVVIGGTNSTAGINLNSTANGTSFINNGGSVGIGTNAPSTTLEVRGSGITSSGPGTGTWQSGSLNLTDTSFTPGHIWMINNRGSADTGNQNKLMTFYNNGSGWINPMTIDTAGNVGIGTPSPTAKLTIGGTSGVDGIKFPDGSLQTTAATSSVSLWTQSSNNITNSNTGDVYMSQNLHVGGQVYSNMGTITNSLNVGNGTGTALQVTGNAIFSGVTAITIPGYSISDNELACFDHAGKLIMCDNSPTANIIHGYVSSGSAISGTGYSSVRTAAGQYTLTFSPAFPTAYPSVVATVIGSTAAFAQIHSVSATTAVIYIYNPAGTTTVDGSFNFVADGTPNN